MSASTEIIPAILAKNPSEFELKLSQIPEEVGLVHVDVLEEDIWTETSIPFEVHLMVDEPEKIVTRWVERGVKRIIAHKALEIEGVEFGLAFKLTDPIKDVGKTDFIHLMSIAEIGEQGHPLDERIFDRIKEVREKFPNIPISVDGGINITNYQKLFDLGADRLVVGSGFKELWQSLTKEE